MNVAKWVGIIFTSHLWLLCTMSYYSWVGTALSIINQLNTCIYVYIYIHSYTMIITYISVTMLSGRNPAPLWMVETLKIMGWTTYQLVQDFFHPHNYHYHSNYLCYYYDIIMKLSIINNSNYNFYFYYHCFCYNNYLSLLLLILTISYWHHMMDTIIMIYLIIYSSNYLSIILIIYL